MKYNIVAEDLYQTFIEGIKTMEMAKRKSSPSKVISLTLGGSDKEVFVVSKHITAFHESVLEENKGMTIMYMSSGNVLVVKESREQILKLFANSDNGCRC